jgi:hypothetical protein
MGSLLNAAILPSNPVEVAAMKAYGEFSYEAIEYLKSNPNASFTDFGVAAVGFSRGPPTSLRFAQILNKKVIQDSIGNL